MTDVVYRRFVKRWEEVTDLPPQTLGPLTPYYKMLVRRLKVMPWPLLFVVGVGVALGIYLLLGASLPFAVSILQRGF